MESLGLHQVSPELILVCFNSTVKLCTTTLAENHASNIAKWRKSILQVFVDQFLNFFALVLMLSTINHKLYVCEYIKRARSNDQKMTDNLWPLHERLRLLPLLAAAERHLD